MAEDAVVYIKRLESRLRRLERIGHNYVPSYAADPTNPQEGLMWYNTAQNRLKLRSGGVTHYFNRDGTG
jgi:hypothetical protein